MTTASCVLDSLLSDRGVAATFAEGFSFIPCCCFSTQVHAIYQQCGHLMLASCNCAVAVQSGDDVIVIDRCTRKRRPFLHIDGTYDDDPLTVMSVDLYLNGELTEGTRVYEESDGKKYIVRHTLFVVGVVYVVNL